jgi:hypothetical protein
LKPSAPASFANGDLSSAKAYISTKFCLVSETGFVKPPLPPGEVLRRDTYYVIFGDNTGYSFFCTVLDHHVRDLEHISLYYRSNGAPVGAYYGAHGTKDGVWLLRQDMEYEGEHPVFYSAKGSHGMYPKPQRYFRYYGIANDLCDKGLRWVPSVEAIDGITDWAAFPGYIMDGNAPSRHVSWDNESPVSISKADRFFGYTHIKEYLADNCRCLSH